nr:hypothetical protein Iba_chr01cCG2250 [Ipomoea batatas]
MASPCDSAFAPKARKRKEGRTKAAVVATTTPPATTVLVATPPTNHHRLLPLLCEEELEVAAIVHRREELLPRQICCCQAPHSSEEGEDEGCYTPTSEVAVHYTAGVLAVGVVRCRGRKRTRRICSFVGDSSCVGARHRSSLLVTATAAVDGKKRREAEGGEKKVRVRHSGESDRDGGSWWPVVASMQERYVKGVDIVVFFFLLIFIFK